MPHFEFSARRVILAGGFAVAIAAAPAVAAFALPSTAPSFGACAGGEEEDLYTNDCLPITVPNSPSSGFTTTAANPDIPEIDGVPCTGRDSGACIGLSEDQPQFSPPPDSTVSSSPTVTGSTD